MRIRAATNQQKKDTAMKTTHKEELYIRQNHLSDRLFDDSAIFFDIETTGFSPAHSVIYLIGCARRTGDKVCTDQFFAEDPSEEKAVICAFLEILKQYGTIICFNGVGFDIPFLKAKCTSYQIEEHLQDYQYLDIFKSVSELKFLLKLPNYKQKTLEDFLGFRREDIFSGGELINVYHDYQKEPSEELLELLYRHNYEDVVGMMDLLPVLSYLEVFHGQYSITETRLTDYRGSDDTAAKEFLITLKNDFSVPRRVSYQYRSCYLTMQHHATKLRIPVYSGELKFFYDNYKDYYYLPEEDLAIHKSVASFVNKGYRERAKAANCYNRRTGDFLPQYGSIMKPEYRRDYKDENRYFEITEDFSSSDVMLRRYVDHILNLMLHAKK